MRQVLFAPRFQEQQIDRVLEVLPKEKNGPIPYVFALVALVAFVLAMPRRQSTRRWLEPITATLLFFLATLVASGCGGSRGNTTETAPNRPSAAPPSIASVSPSSGPRSGGTPVTITGSGFVSGAMVSMGGSICTSLVVASGTQITCTTGAGFPGPADVVVTNPGGLRGVLTSGFSYAIALFVDGDGPNGLNKDVSQDAETPMVASLAGKLYVTWAEKSAATAISQIRVAAYNGDDGAPAWSLVDGNAAFGLNKDATQPAADPRLIVFNAKLYAIWSERSAATTAYQVRVALYNGTDSAPAWTFVDGNATNGINKNAAEGAGTPQLAVFNSKLYATWSEADNDTIVEVRAAVYNGMDLEPAWTFVDGNRPTAGLNKNPAKNAAEPSLIAFNSKLYAAWEEVGTQYYQIRVAVYNGDDASPVWNFVDGNGANGLSKDPSASSFAPTLIVYNSKLYATWLENLGLGATQLRAVVHEGSDAWKFVDGNGANGINHDPLLEAAYPADFPALIVVGDSLYCAWREGIPPVAPDQIRLAAYNGSDSSPAWVFADGNGSSGLNKNPSRNAGAVQLAVLNSKLYLAWQEQNANSKFQIRVATLQ